MSEIFKTSSIINRIKIEYVNSIDKPKLVELAKKYNISYAYLKNVSSQQKWKQLREEVQHRELLSPSDNPYGARDLLIEVGDNLTGALALLTKVGEEFEDYLIVNGKVSIPRVKEFVQTLKLIREEIQATFNYISPAERAKMDIIISKIGMRLKDMSDGEDGISDNFIESLVSKI